jgi:hypothetical protein
VDLGWALETIKDSIEGGAGIVVLSLSVRRPFFPVAFEAKRLDDLGDLFVIRFHVSAPGHLFAQNSRWCACGGDAPGQRFGDK